MPQEQLQVTIYNERVVSDPAVCGGKPIVRGTRIPVEIVLEQLAINPDLDELFVDYPRLTREDVQAVYDFARSLVQRAPRPNGRPSKSPPPPQ